MRILVTGSRGWWCRESIARALDEVTAGATTPIVVVHGDAVGADTIADEEARARGWAVDPDPVTTAEWKQHGRAAGPRRNARMVARGADVCLAFPLYDPARRTGTEDCMDRARRARIPVRVFRPITPKPRGQT